jgi:phospholipase D
MNPDTTINHQLPQPSTGLPPQVAFSPEGICQQTILSALAAARQSVLVQAYEFTNPTIIAALLAAFSRQVRVAALLDPLNLTQSRSALHPLLNAGIPVLIDPVHRIAHNKVIIVDQRAVLTGSYNFTPEAEFANAENLIAVFDPVIVAAYVRNWQSHQAHSVTPNPAMIAATGPGRAGSPLPAAPIPTGQ